MPKLVPLLGVFVVATSCGGPAGKLRPPEIDPDAAGAAAIDQYDANSDGRLSEEELQESALNLRRWDADGDGSLTPAEIATRLRAFLDSGVGLTSLGCFVLLDGKALPGAEIVFEPEEFLGGAVHPASGTSRQNGGVQLSVAEEFRPEPALRGVQFGLFHVRITHPQIKLPAEYNTESSLTYEVSPIDDLPPPRFLLKR